MPLTLSRKKDEAVYIGEDELGCPLVVVSVVEIRGDKVRLSFAADKQVPIHRKEIWLAIETEKAETARLALQPIHDGNMEQLEAEWKGEA